MNLGSNEPAALGYTNNIQGVLNLTGAGNDTLNVDDTGNTTGQTGVLTSSTTEWLEHGSVGCQLYRHESWST